MVQIYFFTGENAFALRQERQLWKARFAEKHGEENMLQLAAADITYRMLLDEIGTMPFIGEKRLVLIDGVPKLEKEEMESLPARMHPSSLLLICDPKPDKRLSAVKILLKIAQVKEFSPLAGSEVTAWMHTYVQKKGAVCQPRAAAVLQEIVGDDQDTLSQELEKCMTFAPGQPITEEAVRRLAVPSGERAVWQLTDDLARGRTNAALQYVEQLLSRGEDPYSVWSILLWMLRNVVTVHAAVQSGERNPAAIAKLGVPFPSVRAVLPLAERLSLSRLSAMVDWAVAADIDLKTGVYRASGEAPEELLALIDSCILRYA